MQTLPTSEHTSRGGFHLSRVTGDGRSRTKLRKFSRTEASVPFKMEPARSGRFSIFFKKFSPNEYEIHYIIRTHEW